MKKFLLSVFTILLLMSCTGDDDSGGSMMLELAPTLSVNLPDYFIQGEQMNFEIVFKRYSHCHIFHGLNLEEVNNVITVGVVTRISSNHARCVNIEDLQASTQINFVAERDDFYIFKFWQGTNSTGRDRFLTVEVPVTQPGRD